MTILTIEAIANEDTSESATYDERELGSAPADRAAADDLASVLRDSYASVLREALAAASRRPRLQSFVAVRTCDEIAPEIGSIVAELERALHGSWERLNALSCGQADGYARRNVSFLSWFEFTRLFERALTRRLSRSFAAEPARLADVLEFERRFMDRLTLATAHGFLDAQRRINEELRELANRRAEKLVESERTLREALQVQNRLFDEGPVPICAFEARTFRFTRVNQAALKLYGRPTG